MKIAAMVMVTLYIIYWSYVTSHGVVADECWKSGGDQSHRATLSLLIVLPTALVVCALVYLWSLA